MLEWYVFAMFIAALVCVVAIVIKVLFSNVKTQYEILDERKREILELYNSVETISEEFQDQAKATIDELKFREEEYRSLVRNMDAFRLPPELEKKEQIIEKVPRSLPLDAGRIKAAGDVIERAERLVVHEPAPAGEVVPPPVPEAKPVFQSFFDDAASAPTPSPYSPASISGGSRRDSILSMYDEGKTDVEIARSLGITRNEVQLVIRTR